MRDNRFSVRALCSAIVLLSYSSADADSTHDHLPEFNEVATYFTTNELLLNGIYDQYQANDRMGWVQCGNNGEYRATSSTDASEIELDAKAQEFFEKMCRVLDIWLVRRVDAGISVHWKDLKTNERRFRIELYRTDEDFRDSCKDEDFRHPVAGCMVPFNSNWAVRYFWLPHNKT